MHELLQHIETLRRTEARGVMATLIGTSGPSPRRVGAKMFVGETGRTLGSVSVGGCIDARVAEVAPDVLRTNEARILSIDMGDPALDLGFTCAGVLEVLVQPVEFTASNSILRMYEDAQQCVSLGGRARIITMLEASFPQMLVCRDGVTNGSLGDPALDTGAAQHESTGIHEFGSVRVFVEEHRPAPLLAVLGAGPVAPAVVQLAHELGLRTIVVDPRAQVARSDALPGADQVCVGDPAAFAASLMEGANTAAALLAHDYKYDLPILRALLASDVAYIGLLGSRRRGRALLDFLADEGFSVAALKRIRVPVGLDLGAESPSELAISIVAEIMAVLRARPATPLSARS